MNKKQKNWSSQTIYNFVHFKSMPNRSAVIWLGSKEEIGIKIANALNDSEMTVDHAKDWFELIAGPKPNLASKNIWDTIEVLLQ